MVYLHLDTVSTSLNELEREVEASRRVWRDETRREFDSSYWNEFYSNAKTYLEELERLSEELERLRRQLY